MTSKSLRRLNLPEAIVDRLAARNIKACKDVLIHAPLDLLGLANCSYPQVQELILACSQACSPPCINGIALRDTHEMPNGRFLSTSLPMLDMVLHGGLPAGNISEITGPPGSGKTQFCIMMSALAVKAAYEKGEGGVIYFDTEGAFSAHRLLEIVQSLSPDLTGQYVGDIVSRVSLIPALSCTELINRMENLEEMIITKGGRLVVVDSVASLIRKEFSNSHHSFMQRNDFITRLAAILKYTARFFKIPAVVQEADTVLSWWITSGDELGKKPLRLHHYGKR